VGVEVAGSKLKSRMHDWWNELESWDVNPHTWEANHYRHQAFAHRVKAIVQMCIGTAAVIWAVWLTIAAAPGDTCIQHANSPKICYGFPPATVILNLAGSALAVATVVELAYTLFTPGPDEALDPLALGLSATVLLLVAGMTDLNLKTAGAVLVLIIALAALFAIRKRYVSQETTPEAQASRVAERREKVMSLHVHLHQSDDSVNDTPRR